MNDRFKFRVWDNVNKRYEKDLPLLDKDGDLCYQDGHKYCNGEHPEDFTIEQCTGLEDKNGNLIFEGDVVRYYRSTAMGLGGERIASVLWRERDAEFYILTTLGDGYSMWEAKRFNIEIIGNIHEMEVSK
jgi:uncharacterized phage protein (TIGR01671 family)